MRVRGVSTAAPNMADDRQAAMLVSKRGGIQSSSTRMRPESRGTEANWRMLKKIHTGLFRSRQKP